jgi:hypothetical protein
MKKDYPHYYDYEPSLAEWFYGELSALIKI